MIGLMFDCFELTFVIESFFVLAIVQHALCETDTTIVKYTVTHVMTFL